MVRTRLTRLWRLIYPVVAFAGGAVALISFLFGDLAEILDRLEPYQTPIIGTSAIIFFVCFYSWLTWLWGRIVAGEIRGRIRKRRDRRRFRTLVGSIAALKQRLHWRPARIGPGEYLDVVIERQDVLSSRLAEITIPTPVRPEIPDYAWEFEKWDMYLDVLLPLAVVGDIDEARMVLGRIEQSQE